MPRPVRTFPSFGANPWKHHVEKPYLVAPFSPQPGGRRARQPHFSPPDAPAPGDDPAVDRVGCRSDKAPCGPGASPGEARRRPTPARHVSRGARRAGGGRKAAKDGHAARQKISTASVPLITGEGKKRPLCGRGPFLGEDTRWSEFWTLGAIPHIFFIVEDAVSSNI